MSHCSSCALGGITLMEKFEDNISDKKQTSHSTGTCKGLNGHGCVYTAQGELVCSNKTTSVENFIDKFLEKNSKNKK